MEVDKRRAGGGGSVVVGAVWESRMKNDEVKGETKVFNVEESTPGEGGGGNGGATLKRSPIGVTASAGKRRIMKSESSEEQCKDKELTVSSSDGTKRSPIQTRKFGASADKLVRSPIQSRKVRVEKVAAEAGGESREGHQKSSGKLRKTQSDSSKKNGCVSGGKSSIELRKTKSESDGVSDESSRNEAGGCDEKIEVENGKNDGDENCKDFDECQEKVISSSSYNLAVVECSWDLSAQDGGDLDDAIDNEADEDDDEVEMENHSFDVKEISIPESKFMNEPGNDKVVVSEPENKAVIDEPEKKKKVVNEPESKIVVNEAEPKRIVSAHMRFHHSKQKPLVSIPHAVKKSPPIRRHSTIYPNFSKAHSFVNAEEYRSFPETQSKWQSLVDLVMWRDVSRSAFVFGMGMFLIVSSSYANDINLSVISVMSYIGLLYLAVIFLYRSLICRGVVGVEDSNYVLGEDEAIWVLRQILPYLNEFLSKLKALFSGDPGTTIKLSVLLFVLARCGSSITIWKMAKFAFFGVFTVPKVCSSYSVQLTACANFWIRRFRDAWDSCAHKKAVALGIFGLVWNLSSLVARIWAVFVLFVAFRYYQKHYLVGDDWVEDGGQCDQTWQEAVGVGDRHKRERTTTFVDINKVKKGL